MNYLLPADSNIAKNCEIRAWNHKDCEKGKGKLVFHIPVANSTEAYIAQRCCHIASHIKSFMEQPLWDDEKKKIRPRRSEISCPTIDSHTSRESQDL
ncbi:hypothetical protein BST61_g9225 [Cercospora zeina]